MRQFCPFHTQEDVVGRKLDDGSLEFVCTEAGHPGGGDFAWLVVPPPPGLTDLQGLANELQLDTRLVEALESLPPGWNEYGLVEWAYAKRWPADFGVMVKRWSHTALEKKRYTASSYIGSTLGRMTRSGLVHYRTGVGTGRWSYNHDASFWSLDPAADWDDRTSWVDLIGEATSQQTGHDVCRDYVTASLAT